MALLFCAESSFLRMINMLSYTIERGFAAVDCSCCTYGQMKGRATNRSWKVIHISFLIKSYYQSGSDLIFTLCCM